MYQLYVCEPPALSMFLGASMSSAVFHSGEDADVSIEELLKDEVVKQQTLSWWRHRGTPPDIGLQRDTCFLSTMVSSCPVALLLSKEKRTGYAEYAQGGLQNSKCCHYISEVTWNTRTMWCAFASHRGCVGNLWSPSECLGKRTNHREACLRWVIASRWNDNTGAISWCLWCNIIAQAYIYWHTRAQFSWSYAQRKATEVVACAGTELGKVTFDGC